MSVLLVLADLWITAMDLAPPPAQCPLLSRALALLEAEPGLRGKPERNSLVCLIAELEAEAIAAGAEERTLRVIRSARSIVDVNLPPPVMAKFAAA